MRGTALAFDGPDLAYTTVATLVRILHEKGFLHATNSERPFRFRPAQSYESVSGRLLGRVVERLFGGSRKALLLRLVEHRKLTSRERKVLEGILAEGER